MAKVRRDNVELTVDESVISQYLEMGYFQVGEGGKVLKAPAPSSTDELKKKVAELTTQLAQANKENQKLRESKTKLSKELEESKAKVEELEVEVDELEDENKILKSRNPGGKPK